MSFFRKKPSATLVTCEDVVAAFGALLESRPLCSDPEMLPFEPELIKTALIVMATRNQSDAVTDAAKTGFVALNSFIGQSRNLDLSVISETEAHALLDREFDALEAEFDGRLSKSRSKINA